MIREADDNFNVAWADPAEAERTWTWDQAHAPRPLPYLAAEVSEILHGGPAGRPRITVNGYCYAATGARPAPSPAPARTIPDGETARIWFEELLPEVRTYCDRLREVDFDSQSEEEIADQLDSIFAELARCYALTLSVTSAFRGAGSPFERFEGFCREQFGGGAGIAIATLLQGQENETATSGLALGQVAGIAARSPELRSFVREGRLDAIAASPAGKEFARALSMFLREYGWRAESFNSVHLATWAEEPALCLDVVRRYLDAPGREPETGRRRAEEQRAAAVRDLEAAIEDPAGRQRFRLLLAAAESYVPINESRAHWQLICGGLSRRPVMALARKLTARGCLPNTNDVWLLRLAELKELAGNPGLRLPPTSIEARTADLARWELLSPPQYLGRAPDSPAGDKSRTTPAVIRGIGASGGRVRGRARIVLSFAEAGKVAPGEILVCPATAPTWMPLFAIVGAVVSDAGGMLSHPAIAAREYAIPCVVGTLTGTHAIPDGAYVTVDGDEGTVLIEG